MNFGIWAENGDIETPSSEKVSSGWDVEKPFKEQMNWVQNRQDRMLQYLNQRGIPEWDSRTDYPKDAYAARSGVVYKALSPNTDKDPSSNTSIWTVAFATQQSFTTLNTEVGKIKNQAGYLSQYVQTNNPVMSANCRGVSYSNTSGESGLFFNDSIPQILNNRSTTAIFQEVTNLSESSKKVVTMDILQLVLQQYKVGDLYLTTNPANPSVTLGYGSWERYGEGRALVGMSTRSSDPDWTKGAGGVFGSYTHTLTTEEIPPHDHGIPASYDMDGEGVTNLNNGSSSVAPRTQKTGGGQAHNNVQPSIAVLVWRRIS